MTHAAATFDRMQKVVSLCKRRGFIFPSSEIYGGLKSAYDYGPLGVELKRNLAAQWWRSMVQQRDDVVGLDAAILMHSRVWEASGHLAGFSDPLVDCLNCRERFRADHAPRQAPGTEVSWRKAGGGGTQTGPVGAGGYVCPACGASTLSDERQFNLMFRTHLGPVDPASALVARLGEEGIAGDQAAMHRAVQAVLREQAVYLRPETAQGMFVQFANVQQSMNMKLPFGIAQVGKSFRNEITVEHFIFRSCEFEQMEMEFFVPPGEEAGWLEYWRDHRLAWWRHFARDAKAFRARAHADDELAHYAAACYDIEYAYPWGFGELEGVASRGDYDLRQHQQHAGVKLSIFDPVRADPATGKPGWRYLPRVIEPAAGLTRGVLVYLVDAFAEEEVAGSDGQAASRQVLRLHPALAPWKAAVLPLVKKDGMPEFAANLARALRAADLHVQVDINHAIGRRYRRHDEVGTPWCVTVDGDSLADGSVTLRERDSMRQQRLAAEALPALLGQRLAATLPTTSPSP